MVGLFNHCIAYVTPTAERPGYYLDATADHNPLDYLRADDQGARVLHVTPQGGEIHDIPYAPPEENSLRRRWEVSLDAAGGGEVHAAGREQRQLRRAPALPLRRRAGRPAPEAGRGSLATAFGAVQVRDAATTSDLEDIALPATLEARFGARQPVDAEGAARTLRLGFDDIGLEQLATEPPERAHLRRRARPALRAGHHRAVAAAARARACSALPPDVEISAPGLLSYVSTRARCRGAWRSRGTSSC